MAGGAVIGVLVNYRFCCSGDMGGMEGSTHMMSPGCPNLTPTTQRPKAKPAIRA